MCSKFVKYAPQVFKPINKIQFISFRNYKITSLNFFKKPILNKFTLIKIPNRLSGNDVTKMMVIHNSRYTFRDFFDKVHFYVMLGVIPYLCIALYAGIFIGKAELREIPEGYEPRHWEYYEHPITRFFIRYAIPHYQKSYETNLHALAEEAEAVRVNNNLAIYQKLESLQDDYKTSYFVHVNPSGVNLAYDNLMLEQEKAIKSPR